MDLTATILAVSSPPGRGGRGIVRISGPHTRDLFDAHLGGCPWKRGVRAARFSLGDRELPVQTLIFEAPRSYTGQDTVELQTPGNPALLQRMIDAMIATAVSRGLDARRAEAGEFTARAWMAGRMSLLEAESVAVSIAAQSDAELRAADMLRIGGLGEFACDLSAELADALALVEAGIDFTDQEDVVPITGAELARLLRGLAAGIDETLQRAVGLEQLRAIPRVVLHGRVNAGKSTLFNALLGHERAVVSGIPGTTRDVLAEPLPIPTVGGRGEVLLIDVAGVDDAVTELDTQMRLVADMAAAEADLVIWCVPADEPVDHVPDGALLVRTKCDLGSTDDAHLRVSGDQRVGLAELRQAVADRLGDQAVSLPPDTVALQHHHEHALASAAVSIRSATEVIGRGDGDRLTHVELVAASMRAALDELAALAGAVTPDDVLGRIFASFCIGK